MIIKSLLNQSGSTIVQGLLLAAALGGGMTYMLKNTEIQNKLVKQTVLKDVQNVVRRELAQSMVDLDTCLRTINGAGPTVPEISGDTIIPNISELTGTVLYKPGDELYNIKLGDMKLDMPDTYGMQAGTRSVRAYFSVMLMENDMRGVAARIPLYLFMKDNKVLVCSSDDGEDFENNLRQVCLDLGGSYNSTTGICANLVGNTGVVRGLIGDTFCAPSSPCSTHPYSNRGCTGVDARGVAHGNWAIQAVNADSSFNCECIPVKACPNRADNCAGVDLGTDWCSLDCGYGTKTDGACAVACTDSSWTPDASDTCSGSFVTQISNCGKTRSAAGTKTGGTCVSCMDSTWIPSEDASKVCTTDFVPEISNCGNSRNVMKGTKSCACSSQTLAHCVCYTTKRLNLKQYEETTKMFDLGQTTSDNCNARTLGYSSCNWDSPCPKCIDSTWTPKVDASTICKSDYVEEESNCGNTRNNVTRGTKDCTGCAVPNEGWWSQGAGFGNEGYFCRFAFGKADMAEGATDSFQGQSPHYGSNGGGGYTTYPVSPHSTQHNEGSITMRCTGGVVSVLSKTCERLAD